MDDDAGNEEEARGSMLSGGLALLRLRMRPKSGCLLESKRCQKSFSDLWAGLSRRRQHHFHRSGRDADTARSPTLTRSGFVATTRL